MNPTMSGNIFGFIAKFWKNKIFKQFFSLFFCNWNRFLTILHHKIIHQKYLVSLRSKPLSLLELDSKVTVTCYYLFLIHNSWQSWCWGRTFSKETEAGSTLLSQSHSSACLALTRLLGSSANIPSRRSRAEAGIRRLNSSLTRLLYCFLGFSCWNPGKWIT